MKPGGLLRVGGNPPLKPVLGGGVPLPHHNIFASEQERGTPSHPQRNIFARGEGRGSPQEHSYKGWGSPHPRHIL